MVRWEAVIVAILGAVLGLAVGCFSAGRWSAPRAASGITALTLPGGQLVVFAVAAALAGILAAILPGRRAARVDMLWAISTA
jgi:putative ABC transport system permease protein